MDEQSQKNFNRIIVMEDHELTNDDIRFLRARRDYLSDIQKEYYSEIFKRDTTPKLVEQPPILASNLKNIASPAPTTEKISYTDLLKTARAQGYKGGRIPRSELEAKIRKS